MGKWERHEGNGMGSGEGQRERRKREEGEKGKGRRQGIKGQWWSRMCMLWQVQSRQIGVPSQGQSMQLLRCGGARGKNLQEKTGGSNGEWNPRQCTCDAEAECSPVSTMDVPGLWSEQSQRQKVDMQHQVLHWNMSHDIQRSSRKTGCSSDSSLAEDQKSHRRRCPGENPRLSRRVEGWHSHLQSGHRPVQTGWMFSGRMSRNWRRR